MSGTKFLMNARHWEETGIVLGALIVLVNIVATGTDFLSGPLFGPVYILVGVFLVYVAGLFLIGMSRDHGDPSEQDSDYPEP